ncbi:MAG: PAS domain S-box protein, partial [bacterium]
MNSGFFLLTLFSCSAIVFVVFSALLAYRSGRSAEAEPYLWWSAGLLAEATRYGLAASAWRIEPSWHAFPANALWPVSAFLLLAGVLRHGGKSPVPYKVLAGCLAAAGWGLGAQWVPVSSRLAAAPLVLAGSAALFYGGGLMLLRAAGNRELRGWVLGGCLVAIGGARLVTPLAGEGAAALGWENALMLVLGSAFATALLWPGPRSEAAKQGGGTAEERVFTEILDALPIPAVIVRFSDGEILFANPLVGKLFGTTREQVIGQKDVDFYLNPEDLKEVSRKVVRDGRLMGHPVSMRRQDGTPVFVRISVVPIAFRGQRAAITGVYDVTDLKIAEQEARTAETRMRMVLANAPIILYALDADGIITLSEGRELASVGRKPGEVVGESVFEVFQHLPDRIAHLRRGLAGEAFTADVNVDGVWFRARHEPMLDQNGAVAGLTVLSTNISRRRKAEEERERMAAVVEQTADVIIITDTEGIVTYANPAFEKASGYGREEAIGQKTRFLNSGVHDDTFYRHLWTTLQKGEAWTGHF